MDEWLKVADVARYLGVQPHTVYRLIEQGKLPASCESTTVLRANGTHQQRKTATRVSAADLRAFIEAARVKSGDLRALYAENSQ